MDDLVDKIEKTDWYHIFDLGTFRTHGHYDISKVIHQYKLPLPLNGKHCLDVGTSNGYFAFYMEQQGAESVTAVDVKDWIVEADVSLQHRTKLKQQYPYGLGNSHKGGFDIMHEYYKSRVKYQTATIYELDKLFSSHSFDIVLCSNLLLHLYNPYLALENLFNVAKEKVIISTNIYIERFSAFRKSRPILVVSEKSNIWFDITPKSMEILARKAGFSRIHFLGKYIQRNEMHGYDVPVGIWHLYV
jgi:ubiquinone/menaquinone biosynthesis C-methylase UbiE